MTVHVQGARIEGLITTKRRPASRCSVLRQSRLSCLHASDELIPEDTALT